MTEFSPFIEATVKENLFLPVQDLRKIIGVDAGNFQQWLARELIPFESVKAGKRTFRRFPIKEIPRLILIASVWNCGLSIGDAIQVADIILHGMEEYDDIALVAYVRSSGNVWVFTGDGDEPDKALAERLSQDGVSSCILISFMHLEREIESAMRIAKRIANEG